ncbi:Wadjet anti-phage system protein JetD domain-containing protein [Lacinutrix chionoecetis]
MITPEEILKKANRKYTSYLQSKITDDVFFPLIIPGNKIPSKSTLNYSEEIKILYLDSKENKGYGYEITYAEKRKKGLGLQSLPTLFTFTNETDYLKYLGKQKEVDLFHRFCDSTFTFFPQLKDVIYKKPGILLKNLSNWEDLLKVCTYFKNNPRPNLYIRELPIKVHTKFVEKNQAALTILLEAILIPSDVSSEKRFEKKFGLKCAEPMIRFKILDQDVADTSFSGVNDVALPISNFKQLNLDVSKVVIVENKTSLYTALTLPNMHKTIAIFGQGFGVSSLKGIDWLKTKEVLYWGDFDAHGFEILSQVRGYYPQTKSVLMDKMTFDVFFENDKGAGSKVSQLDNLTEAEIELHRFLLENNYRLEQEKIPNDYVIKHFIS